jgi:hypothetical protein
MFVERPLCDPPDQDLVEPSEGQKCFVPFGKHSRIGMRIERKGSRRRRSAGRAELSPTEIPL